MRRTVVHGFMKQCKRTSATLDAFGEEKVNAQQCQGADPAARGPPDPQNEGDVVLVGRNADRSGPMDQVESDMLPLWHSGSLRKGLWMKGNDERNGRDCGKEDCGKKGAGKASSHDEGYPAQSVRIQLIVGSERLVRGRGGSS